MYMYIYYCSWDVLELELSLGLDKLVVEREDVC